MTAIKDAYINALFADSVYITGFIDGMSPAGLKTIQQQRMTPTQAQFIADHFSVVSTINTPDDFGEGSGFDAVVWRGNDGTDYAEKIYVSMRGTEGINDFLADIDLAVNTAASAQYEDMINWWLRISTPVGQMAPQVSRVGIGAAFVAAPPVAGTGEVAGVTQVQVNGHSLGGHLASAFARIFGNTLVIDGVSTFNSAGFIANSEAVFGSLAQALGTGPTQYRSAAQTNYFARNGINVTTNSFYFNQIGQRQDIFNEQSGPLATHENHSMYKLTDTLALGNALSQIAPELSLETFNEILEAASATPAASLESLLDALRRLTTGDSPSPTPVGDASDSAASRVAYHQNLLFWVDSTAF
ncbi:hypothetical protein ACNQFN_22345 [Thauera butanivorans]|uniref:hypothetical protein n=1 Tax=Thauera butanivorans TaxID=86174 RepID=UPI003AB3D93A